MRMLKRLKEISERDYDICVTVNGKGRHYMKKKLRYMIITLILLGCASGAVVHFMKANGSPEVEDGFVAVSKAKNDINMVMTQGENQEYNNLNFEHITPIIPETDYVCDVTVTYSGDNNPLTKDNVKEKIEVFKAFYGEDIDLKDTRIDTFEGKTLQEYLEDGTEENEGEDNVWHHFLYIKDEDYGQISSSSLWIDMGFEGTCPDFSTDSNKIYYVGGSNLNDTYNTLSGEMSVQDAIDNVEDYFNKNFPINMNTELEYKAFRVAVQKEDNNLYSFLVFIRHSYNGISFESAYEGNSAYQSNEHSELAKVVLAGADKITFFNSVVINQKVEEGERTNVIVSLDTALRKISESLGNNSEYRVKEIELGYDATADYENGKIFGKPAWIVYTDNLTDTKETRFYVDVRTGEVHARVMG